MAAEVWISFILKIIITLIVAHIAITKIVPLLNDFLISFIKDKNAVNSFTSLIDILVLVLVGSQIVLLTKEVNNSILNYVTIIEPATELLRNIFSYIQWILLVLIAVVALKNLKSIK